MKEIEFKIDNNLTSHVCRALKEKWYLSIIVVIFVIVCVILSAINIKIVEYITALLVSKSVVASAQNKEQLYELLKQYGLTQQQINDFLSRYATNEAIEKLINTMFYDYIKFDGQKLYIVILGFNFSVYNFLYLMVSNISGVVLFSYFMYLLSGYIARSYETNLKHVLIKNLIDQDLHYFSENKTGEIISTLVKDTSIIGLYVKDAPVGYLRTILTVTVSSIIMFTVDWKLTLCVFGLLIICMILVFLFSVLSVKSTKKISKLTTDFDNNMSEKIYNIRLIKSIGTFDEEKQNFKTSASVVDKKNKLKLFLSEIPAGLIIGGVGSFSMASVIFGVILYYDNSQTLISIITTFTSGVIVMTLPLLDLRNVLNQVPNARYGSKNVYRLLNQEIKIDKHKKTIFSDKVDTIKFENLSFSYPESDKVILNNINITFNRGKKYAFVGPTGSGKSTIAKLLLRFYDPFKGDVIINNKTNLKDINLKSWLDKIGYVDQEPQILSGTILDNIKYGLNDIDDNQVIEAAKKAKLHDLINGWDEGYQTILFERGSQLSGGQKQRLVIARLILKNPEVLILDEATSALDNKVEKEIQEELEKLMVGRTTISIAHRLSTIKSFDNIFVIEPHKGIVQSGNYNKLIKEDGLFKILYELSN
ncbi:ABC transporter ATP-binding protein/permease [Spiroplasma gladiatoris]|uniref:ABC transporter ATP-binding protein/permease n=1 Tax=Spiroplasma gladiatoris TaxID=2143 RepID=A0A4P7AHD5_9MOLU|nr:ABC transporter ATP-binding protein [Spiroplasma gladiatoris]QBQ07597.1 ABC transporter ATP-binding protein/permease [Spiroplasma gladiatoris]